MRALIQRVREASVEVDGARIGGTGPGLLVLICAMEGDGADEAAYLARKIANLRIFADEAGRMNLSCRDIAGGALVVSQFTLAADTKRGNRPGFSQAAAPDTARDLYHAFTACLAQTGIPVETGRFGADMQIRLINDGPVTIWMDTDQR